MRRSPGIEHFQWLLGTEPITYAARLPAEGIYFGPDRLTGIRRRLLQLYAKRKASAAVSRPFEQTWGDVCKSYVKYVRNLVFNTLKQCPEMPVHPAKPYVNYWFASYVNIGLLIRRFQSQPGSARRRRWGVHHIHPLSYGFCFGGRLDP